MKVNGVECKIETYQCSDCSIGEVTPCIFTGLNPDAIHPMQCPIDEHGIASANWTAVPTRKEGVDSKYPTPKGVALDLIMSLTQINRSFSVIYGTPSDILCGVDISVKRAACLAGKGLALPVSKFSASIAGLACVGRVYDNKRNSVQLRLIINKLSELMETPLASSASFFLRKFGIVFTNTFQIFYSYTKIFLFGQTYNTFTESMIDKGSCGLFTPSKPFQEPMCAPCAFALNRSTNSFSFQSIIVNTFRRNIFSIRKRYDIINSKIYTKKLFDIVNLIFRKLYSLKKKEFALPRNKISLTFDIGKPVSAMADKRNSFQSSIDSPDRNSVFTGKYSTIISDSANRVKRSFGFLIKFIRIRNFAYTAYNHLRREIELIFNGLVDFVMKLKLIKDFLIPSYIRNVIACFISLLYSRKQRLSLFNVRKQLDLQYQFHKYNIVHLFEEVNTYFERVEIPPVAKAMGFLSA